MKTGGESKERKGNAQLPKRSGLQMVRRHPQKCLDLACAVLEGVPDLSHYQDKFPRGGRGNSKTHETNATIQWLVENASVVQTHALKHVVTSNVQEERQRREANGESFDAKAFVNEAKTKTLDEALSAARRFKEFQMSLSASPSHVPFYGPSVPGTGSRLPPNQRGYAASPRRPVNASPRGGRPPRSAPTTPSRRPSGIQPPSAGRATHGRVVGSPHSSTSAGSGRRTVQPPETPINSRRTEAPEFLTVDGERINYTDLDDETFKQFQAKLRTPGRSRMSPAVLERVMTMIAQQKQEQKDALAMLKEEQEQSRIRTETARVREETARIREETAQAEQEQSNERTKRIFGTMQLQNTLNSKQLAVVVEAADAVETNRNPSGGLFGEEKEEEAEEVYVSNNKSPRKTSKQPCEDEEDDNTIETPREASKPPRRHEEEEEDDDDDEEEEVEVVEMNTKFKPGETIVEESFSVMAKTKLAKYDNLDDLSGEELIQYIVACKEKGLIFRNGKNSLSLTVKQAIDLIVHLKKSIDLFAHAPKPPQLGAPKIFFYQWILDRLDEYNAEVDEDEGLEISKDNSPSTPCTLRGPRKSTPRRTRSSRPPRPRRARRLIRPRILSRPRRRASGVSRKSKTRVRNSLFRRSLLRNKPPSLGRRNEFKRRFINDSR